MLLGIMAIVHRFVTSSSCVRHDARRGRKDQFQTVSVTMFVTLRGMPLLLLFGFSLSISIVGSVCYYFT